MSVYLKLIWAYLKIGLFGFGGGYAMLSLIQREVVDSGWISSTTFTDIVAISQMTPGPIGINSATYIGYVVTGSVWGSVLATFTVVLPPFILVLYASHFIRKHKESAIIKGVFMGLRPVVVGLIASAALLLVMVVTHERELVNRFTKRVVAISEGRIISDGMDGYYLNEEE